MCVTSAWSKNNGNINIFQLLKTSQCSYMVFSVAYRYRKSIWLLRGWLYIYYIYNIYEYVKFLASHFSDLARCKNFTGWAIIEELSIRWRLRTFLISCGHKTRVKHCYVDLSSRYKFWYAMICITNIISDLSTTIWDGFDSLPVKWVNTGFYFLFLNTTGNNSVTVCLC